MSIKVAPFVAGDSGETSGEIEVPEFRIYTLDEFVQRPTGSTLVRGVIPARSIVVVFGPPKGGKTFSVCDLALHAAHGLDWHGCTVSRRIRVVYLAGEGVSGLKVRLKAWLEHHDNIEVPGEFRILPHALPLPERVHSIVDTLQKQPPDIVVIDTLNAYFGGGDENATHDMTSWCNALRYLRDNLGCSVVVVHHTGHGDSGRERGSIVLRASADVLVQVAKDESTGTLIGFQVISARDLEAMEVPISLRLARHETGWVDEDGQPLMSCVVVAGNLPVTLPGRGGQKLGPVQAAVLEAAHELASGSTPDGKGEVIVARHAVAELLKNRDGRCRQSVSSAWQPLADRKLLRLVEPGSVAVRIRK